MKRFFLLLGVICVLYGLSWANFGSSVDGEQAAVTFTHTADCDSARADFGYDGDGGADTLNFYASLQLFPCFSGDGMILMGEGLELDSIGTHVVKITYFLDDGDATADGYVAGIWIHENPNLTALEIWSENLSGYITANWAGTHLRYLSDNQDWNQWDNPKTDTSTGMGDWFADWFNANYWLTSDGDTNTNPFDASSDKVTLVDSSAEDISYTKNHPDDFKADVSGLSTFDPASDNVAVVDSVTGVARVDSVRKVYILDSLDQTVSAEADTEAIARYTWSYAVRTLTSGTGTGSNQVTIRVKSSTDSSAIPGATIAVWNSDQSSLMGLLSSNSDSGKAVFALDNGTYNLRIQKYKFQWTVPITIGVSGNKDTTVYATEFTPSPPPAPYFVTVYGYLDSVGLIGQRAKISCTIHAQELRYGSVLLGYYSYTKTTYTNASGYWEMFLYANEDLTPAGTQYEFVIETPYQQIIKKWVTVSTPGPWEFTW